jgi:type IV pilus assembly protein PilA
MQKSTAAGFTILELMVVLVVIAILATLALPSFEYKNTRVQINESLELIKTPKESINLFYLDSKKFPRNNIEAGIPKPEFLIGNYVQRVDVINGSLQLTFGNKASARLKNMKLTLRPMVVKDSPESPISWVCGHSGVPEGMIAIGTDNTDIDSKYLPLNCF